MSFCAVWHLLCSTTILTSWNYTNVLSLWATAARLLQLSAASSTPLARKFWPLGRPRAMFFGPTHCKSKCDWLIHPSLLKLPHAVKAFCPWGPYQWGSQLTFSLPRDNNFKMCCLRKTWASTKHEKMGSRLIQPEVSFNNIWVFYIHRSWWTKIILKTKQSHPDLITFC